MAKRKQPRTNWANVLTWTRLALLVPITLFAYLGMRGVVFALIIAAVLTDVFDGIVARRSNVASEGGALFDSRVDHAMGACYLVWLWLLFPQTITLHFIAIGTVLFLVGIKFAITWKKLGTASGLHLWSGKLFAGSGFLMLPAFILFDYHEWIVTTIIVLAIIAYLEGIVYLLKGGKNLDARFFWDE